ncbi:MAG: RES family NAD+ phosphorylase [bacterium]|nr:RES family NAD+ phosphorylase [bacterium]
MSSRLPLPPARSRLDPLIHLWKQGERLVRCHDSRFGATEFNPGLGDGRFHPLEIDGAVAPTLYGSDSSEGAISETVFHGVPVRGPSPTVRHSTLLSMMASTLSPLRDLELAQLHGHGLRRLGLSRSELIDCPAEHYRETRRWAAAIHACEARVDGMIWVSRQHDTSLALILFGDRVERDRLAVVEPPLPLAWGPGLNRVQQAAEASAIQVIM